MRGSDPDLSGHFGLQQLLPWTRGSIEIIDRARNVYLPVVVLGELRTGFVLGRRRRENEIQLQRFLAEPVVEILDIDDEAPSVYADLWATLRRAGTPVPTNDVWIAAVAVRDGATVLTYDHHFDLIARVGTHILGFLTLLQRNTAQYRDAPETVTAAPFP